MMTSLEFVPSLLLAYKYWVIPPATVLFGPPVGLAVGFFIHTGHLELVPACVALIGGELTADTLWYLLGMKKGERFAARFGRYINITPENIAAVQKLFTNHHGTILILTKLTSGFGFASVVMFAAGLAHVPYKRYILFNTAAQIIWTACLLTLGYYFGHLYTSIASTVEKVMLVAAVAIILAAFTGFGHYLRNTLAKDT